MPSENYHNQGGALAQNHPKYSPASFADLYPEQSSVAAIRERRLGRGVQAAKKSYEQVPQEYQKELQNKLRQVRKVTPNLPKEAKKAFVKGGPTWGLIKSASGIFRQIDWSIDWLFFLLISFAFLKDIFDMVFAAVSTATALIPILGEVSVAIGIIITFVGEIMILLLTVTVLVLTGSSLKNRGMAKYFMFVPIAFMSEALPGIGWLPLCCLEAVILYVFVLYDRAYQEPATQEVQNSAEDIPAFATADKYYEGEERLAA